MFSTLRPGRRAPWNLLLSDEMWGETFVVDSELPVRALEAIERYLWWDMLTAVTREADRDIERLLSWARSAASADTAAQSRAAADASSKLILRAMIARRAARHRLSSFRLISCIGLANLATPSFRVCCKCVRTRRR